MVAADICIERNRWKWETSWLLCSQPQSLTNNYCNASVSGKWATLSKHRAENADCLLYNLCNGNGDNNEFSIVTVVCAWIYISLAYVIFNLLHFFSFVGLAAFRLCLWNGKSRAYKNDNKCDEHHKTYLKLYMLPSLCHSQQWQKQQCTIGYSCCHLSPCSRALFISQNVFSFTLALDENFLRAFLCSV